MATASVGENATGLGNKRKASSPVWEYFWFSPDDKGQPANSMRD